MLLDNLSYLEPIRLRYGSTQLIYTDDAGLVKEIACGD